MATTIESGGSTGVTVPQAGDTLRIEACVLSVTPRPQGAVVDCECTLANDRGGDATRFTVEVTIPVSVPAQAADNSLFEVDLACPPL